MMIRCQDHTHIMLRVDDIHKEAYRKTPSKVVPLKIPGPTSCISKGAKNFLAMGKVLSTLMEE